MVRVHQIKKRNSSRRAPPQHLEYTITINRSAKGTSHLLLQIWKVQIMVFLHLQLDRWKRPATTMELITWKQQEDRIWTLLGQARNRLCASPFTRSRTSSSNSRPSFKQMISHSKWTRSTLIHISRKLDLMKLQPLNRHRMELLQWTPHPAITQSSSSKTQRNFWRAKRTTSMQRKMVALGETQQVASSGKKQPNRSRVWMRRKQRPPLSITARW